MRYEVILTDEVKAHLRALLLSLRRNVKPCALRTAHATGFRLQALGETALAPDRSFRFCFFDAFGREIDGRGRGFVCFRNLHAPIADFIQIQSR